MKVNGMKVNIALKSGRKGTGLKVLNPGDYEWLT